MIDGLNVIRKIKQGGQKEVYLVSKDSKEMIYKQGKCNSNSALKRIIREVEILREIDSDFFPKNYYFEFDEKEKSFHILEEYIRGNTLNHYMNKYENEKEIAQLILDIIAGMKLLWKKEIVHRDLKPENIIISEKTGKPVIIDLGIARSLLEESLTKTIFAIGPCTIPYASPEQLLNQKNLISPRSDFFSLGIIAMELYYKHNPFDPQWVESGESILQNIITGNKRINIKENKDSKNFTNLFLKALETLPFNRYRKYEGFEKALLNFLNEGEANE